MSENTVVGRWFHQWTHDAKGARIIQYQGKVLSKDGDDTFVQLYSFADGEPSRVEKRSWAEIVNGDWTWYPSCDEMNRVYYAEYAYRQTPSGKFYGSSLR